ncbi:MAG TPA: DUF4440 domain-containing protein [Gemmatimonadales bacterium]|jgi:uncharacterized protein (TIGR02246 family)
MRHAAQLLVVMGLGFGLACGGQAKPRDTAADEAAIRAIDASFNEFLRSQNDSAIAATYAADAVLFPPSMPRVTGSENIRKFFAEIWPLKASLEITPGTIRVFGDLAVEDGTWTWSAPTPQGEQKDNGKYLVSWRRSGNTWLVVQDIWNSDNPPPPPPPAK